MGRLGQVAVVVGTAVLLGATSTGCVARSTSSATPSAKIRAAAGQMYSAGTVHIHGSVGATVIDGWWQFAPSPVADLNISAPTRGGKLTLGSGASDGSARGEVVVDGATAYLRVPADFIAAAVRKSKPDPIWFSSSLVNQGGLLGKVNADPRKLVEELLAVSDFAEMGGATVDKVATTHYSSGSSGPSSSTPAPSPSSRAAGTADVWLDAQGLPVKVKLGGQGVGLDLHFTDWGALAPIIMPPASQVIPFSSDELAIPFAISGETFKVSAGSGTPSCLVLSPEPGTDASTFSLKGITINASASGACSG